MPQNTWPCSAPGKKIVDLGRVQSLDHLVFIIDEAAEVVRGFDFFKKVKR
jgi:hypothetical protein